jgi:hypothetical protein
MNRKVLTAAGIQALSELFPDWRIWAEADSGWHACRKGGFVQNYDSGAAAFSVHASGPAELAGLLRWQEAIDHYGPFACVTA